MALNTGGRKLIEDFTIPVNQTITVPNTNIPNSGGIYWDWDKWTAPNPNPIYGYFTYTYPATIYKYQITCPRCEKFNWLELDKIQVCATKKCGAKLKAVSEKVDFEVAINE